MVSTAFSRKLGRSGVESEIIDPQTLKPLDVETILNSVKKTGRLVVVNEACRSCGFAAEVAAMVAERAHAHLKAPIQRVTAKDAPMPVSRDLETEILPSEQDLMDAVGRVIPEVVHDK